MKINDLNNVNIPGLPSVKSKKSRYYMFKSQLKVKSNKSEFLRRRKGLLLPRPLPKVLL